MTTLRFIVFLQCLAILRAFCQWKIEHKVRKCFVKCFILRTGTWLDAREMQAICMKVVKSSSVASPKFLGANTSTLSEQQYFVRDTAFQRTKWQDMLKLFWGAWPPSPLSTHMFTRKNEKERTALTWCSIIHWQKALNNARPPDTATAELRWKAKLLSVLDGTFGCYQQDTHAHKHVKLHHFYEKLCCITRSGNTVKQHQCGKQSIAGWQTVQDVFCQTITKSW